jgi:hypothetical protein
MLLAVACSTVATLNAADSSFETRHEQALRQNPAGVTLSLRTLSASSTFHLFETIPIDIAYRSSRASVFAIEMDEAMNFAGGARRFEIDDPNSVLLTYLEWGTRGVICCASDMQALAQRPTVFKRELTDYVRFQSPGTYRIYLVTRRVFRAGSAAEPYAASKLTLTSNILTLTILPDDPDWDAGRLSELLLQLDDPKLKANHEALNHKIELDRSEPWSYEAMADQLDRTPFSLAQKALNALDTPEAIRERVNRMQLLTSKEIRFDADHDAGSIIRQPLLASSIRPDLIVAEMERRAQKPNFGVDYDYADYWARFLAMRDQDGIFRPFPDSQEQQKRIRSFLLVEAEAKRQVVAELRRDLAEKSTPAKEVTATTIRILESDISHATKTKSSSPD